MIDYDKALSKFTVGTLRNILQEHKREKCAAISRLRRLELIELIKKLKLTDLNREIRKPSLVTKKVTPPRGNTTTPSKSLSEVRSEFNQVKKNLVAKVKENKSVLKQQKEIKNYNKILQVDINNYKNVETINKMIMNVKKLDKVITKLILKSIVK
tara:strand:+ start:1412 stop:1876 length:465 start_codon:yes stop_codon:yes gene_type:complete